MTHQYSHNILSPGKVGIYERERESWETGEAEYKRERRRNAFRSPSMRRIYNFSHSVLKVKRNENKVVI